MESQTLNSSFYFRVLRLKKNLRRVVENLLVRYDFTSKLFPRYSSECSVWPRQFHFPQLNVLFWQQLCAVRGTFQTRVIPNSSLIEVKS